MTKRYLSRILKDMNAKAWFYSQSFNGRSLEPVALPPTITYCIVCSQPASVRDAYGSCPECQERRAAAAR